MEKALKKWFPLFVLPTLAAFCVGFIWPFIQGIYLSFCKFTTVNNAKFVGLSNYVKALTDASYGNAFKFTVSFAIVSTILINVLAFLIARFDVDTAMEMPRARLTEVASKYYLVVNGRNVTLIFEL